MFTSHFKMDEKLDDSSNYVVWRTRLDVTLDENDVLGYVEGKVPKPLENASTAIKSKYKKGEIKAKNIIIDSLREHLIFYILKLKKSKEMYDKLVGIYEIKKLSHILYLKNELKDTKMNTREIVQSDFMRISKLKDQSFSAGEITSNRELVLISLGGIPPI